MKYIQLLLRRKWVILVTTALAVGVAVVGSSLLPTTYTSTTVLRVLTPPSGSLSQIQYELGYADRILATYTEMAMSEPVMEEVMAELDLQEEPNIKVNVLANTELMEINVTDKDPTLARNVANAVAQALIKRSKEIYSGSGPSATEILKQQLDQVQKELEQARQEYENLISVTNPNAERIDIARSTLNLKEQIYAQLVSQYEEARASEAFRTNIISVFQPAKVPDSPSGLPHFVIIGLGGVLGVIGGIGLAFLFENLDTKLYTLEQIEKITRLPIVGKIPSSRKQRQIALYNHNSYEEEAFRRLRTNIFPPRREMDPLTTIKGIGPTYAEQLNKAGVYTYAQLAAMQPDRIVAIFDAPKWRAIDADSWITQAKTLMRNCANSTGEGDGCLRTLLITSAKPQEGKSTIAANLALTLAKTKQRVLLIDGDLRLPTVHTIFGRPNDTGLSSVLQNEAPLEDAIQETEFDGVHILTSGPTTTSSSDLLNSPAMQQILQQLIRQYDVILVDSPALLAVTDAATLAPVVDGVVLVVRRTSAHEEDIAIALEQLASVKADPVGVVVNRAKRSSNRRYYRHYTPKK